MTQFSMKVKDLEPKASVEPQATHEQPSELSGQPACQMAPGWGPLTERRWQEVAGPPQQSVPAGAGLGLR